MVDNKTLQTLEYDKVLKLVSKFAMSSSGVKAILNTKPTTDYKEVCNLIRFTEEAYIVLYHHALIPELSFDDVGDIFDKVKIGSVLSMGELLTVSRILHVSRLIQNLIMNINDDRIVLLKELSFNIAINQLLEEDITRSIMSETEMSDNASANLKDIRRAIINTNVQLRNTLNQYVADSQYNKYLQDSIITIRNGRYVIPVRSEYKNQIGGLVHDQSASGATVFIEPFNIVKLNNELTQLKLSEIAEIDKILRIFSVRVANDAELCERNFEIAVQLDSVFAKATYSHINRCNLPIIACNGEFNIIKGRHPLIDKDKVVALDIDMNGDEKILLVTGPNTGGKTVSLKLTGLFSLMVMAGIFPLAEYGTVINVFDNIFADIGDMQSIENSLSTFSSHLSNIINITDNLTSNCLVLLDELGGGTDPTEGAALAVGVLKHVLKCGASAIITTHYRQLKDFALTDKRIKCAAMDFDSVSYAPTYRLIMNSAGGSKAMQIAKRLGLDEKILEEARASMSVEEIAFDTVMESAEKSRSVAENLLMDAREKEKFIADRLIEIETQYKEVEVLRRKLDEKMKQEVNRLLKDYIDEAEDAIAEIQDLVKNASEENLFKARKIKSELNKKLDYSIDTVPVNTQAYDDNGTINIGDAVFVVSINKNAIVVSINERKHQYGLKIGAISSNVPFDKVKKLKNKYEKSENIVCNYIKHNNNEAVPLELKVIGQNVEEALYNIENYINAAVMVGYTSVRIVHGKGSGVLRKAIGNHFLKHSNIKSFRLGKYGEGDDGVTIAELK